MEQHEVELDLPEIVARLPKDVDLVITEGYKRAPTPKIEVIREGYSDDGRIAKPDELLALVRNPLPSAEDDVPCFALDDAEGVAKLLEAKGYIKARGEGTTLW